MSDMTPERAAYLSGRRDAKSGLVTLEDAAAKQNMQSLAGLYYCGACDQLTGSHLELA